MPTLQEFCNLGDTMPDDILSQEEVNALLAGVTGETDDTPRESQPTDMLLNNAKCELAYWTGVVHALTGKVKTNSY